MNVCFIFFFFFSSRRRHTRFDCDWSSDVCSSDLWVMHNRKIGVADYEWLATTFNPSKFDAAAWAALAQRAGVRYITITSRHHDGFSMFKTAQTPYNIVDWTPVRRDPPPEPADACHAA